VTQAKLYVVTGGAGFIGSNLVDALVRRGDRVRVLDDLSTGRRENLAGQPAVEVVVGALLRSAERLPGPRESSTRPRFARCRAP